MKYFNFEHVKEVRVVGLSDFELVVDAHQDGDASSIVLSGTSARPVAVVDDDDVITVHGQDGAPSRAKRPLTMTGTFVTSILPIPLIAVPRQPLRIRYGGTGEPPVSIEVALPLGQRVVLRGPFGTVTTAAPRERKGRYHEHLVSTTTQRMAREMLNEARSARGSGTLGEAIRAHSLEQEAQRILNRDRRKRRR